MSSADDLRTLVAEALYASSGQYTVDADDNMVPLADIPYQEFYFDQADAVLAVLSSHPEAVLSLLGTVRKGWLQEGAQIWRVYDIEVPQCEPVFVVSLAETAKDAS